VSCRQTDQAEPGTRNRWLRHPLGGPPRDGIYGDGAEPAADQWIYHALHAVSAAHGVVAADPGVDRARVGLCGISWGGVITATAMGIDPRIAFAIPTYGCGFLAEQDNQYRAAAAVASYRDLWEPGLRFGRAAMPSLWMTGLKDAHFSLVQQAKSYRAVRGPHMVSIQPQLAHGHGAAWARPEPVAFARSIVETGRPWAAQIGRERDGATVRAAFRTDRAFAQARLFSTGSTGHSSGWAWTETPAAIATRGGGETVLSAALPDGARAWFFTSVAGDLIVSSDLEIA